MNDDRSFPLFNRNKEIEAEIDRKFAFYSIRIESITLYFNVLDELICDFNNIKDRLSLSKLNNYISSRRLSLESYDYDNVIYNGHPFNNQEVDYLKSVTEYLRNLRESKIGSRFHLYNLIDYIKDVALKSTSISYIKSEVERYISHYRFIYYHVDETCGNLYVYLHKYDYCIAVILNSDKFEIVNQRWVTSMIVLDNVSKIVSKAKSSNNVIYIYYLSRHEFFERVYIGKPFDWYLRKIEYLLSSVEKKHTLILDNLFSAREIAHSLNQITHEYQMKIDEFKVHDIKQLRNKLMKVLNLSDESFDVNKQFIVTLKILIDTIPLTYNAVKSKFDLRQKISFALSEIRKNNTLYIVSKNNKKNEDYAFGEENLTAILASNLRCLYYPQQNVSVHCEAMVGNGRSDVSLSVGRETFGLIEAKLINKKSNVESETRNAIEQLFSRYSENDNIDGNSSVSLCLIIFAYDKDFRALAKSVQSAVLSYSERNDLIYEGINKTENGIKFLYKEKRSDIGFMDKIRVIDIMVCNMEIDYKTRSKQRTQNKQYNPTRST